MVAPGAGAERARGRDDNKSVSEMNKPQVRGGGARSGIWRVLALALLLSGCASAGGARSLDDDETYDPLEPVNRAVFTFNEKFDRWVLKGVSRAYHRWVPDPLQDGVGNFFSNLWQPVVVISDVMQGKVSQAGADGGRFVINSTVGLLGFFDVAKHMGLEPHDEDIGQALAVWGVGEGPYLVLPFIGPRTTRDAFGWVADSSLWPVTRIDDPSRYWRSVSLYFVDTRARYLPSDKVVEMAAGDDKYLFIREAYRQRRRSLIYDGNPPRPQFFEDEPPPPNNRR